MKLKICQKNYPKLETRFHSNIVKARFWKLIVFCENIKNERKNSVEGKYGSDLISSRINEKQSKNNHYYFL